MQAALLEGGTAAYPSSMPPLPHTLQFFLVASALYVGYTHCLTTNHWSDVLVGLLHSTLVVHLTVYYISDIFKTWPHSTDWRKKSWNGSPACH